jgi:protein-tyrosine phosphatase
VEITMSDERHIDKPINFRTHQFFLFGKPLEIAAMAGPHNNKNPDEALAYLKTNHRDVLIGLHDARDFTKEATQNRLSYIHIPVTDFAQTPIPVEIYDEIYKVIKKATNDGQAVTIHCGAGDGRSGTALASLKLRELLEAEIIESFLLDKVDENISTTVHVPMLATEVPCSLMVKQAVEKTRNERGVSDGGNGVHSVETANDIATLMQYEQHLRNTLHPVLVFNAADLTTYLKKAIEKEKIRLIDSPEDKACVIERLAFLESLQPEQLDKKETLTKLKVYHALVQVHQMLQDLKNFIPKQENCSDELKQEKLNKINLLMKVAENREVSVASRLQNLKAEGLSPEFEDLLRKDSDIFLVRWIKLFFESLFNIPNPSTFMFSMFTHKIENIDACLEDRQDNKKQRI